MIFVIETIIYMVMFGFVLFQQWKLKKCFDSPAWRWNIAGYWSAFFGLLLRIGINYLIEIPADWRYHILFINNAITMGCLIRSKHLLREGFNSLNKTLRTYNEKSQ